MLQQNNNNNYPCLDMTHRELLQGCSRSSTPFSSALGFGAIPLIKGLRAWAVSGGYSRSRRRAAPVPQASQPPQEGGRAGQRVWSGPVGSGHRKTQDSIASFRNPGLRQGGLGALVTVATLKGSEGGRQTQTRCLFLKAEGCSYLCAVGDRTTGCHRTRSRVQKGNEGDAGVCEVKPQVIRKWRKSGKIAKSTESSLVAESRADVDTSKQEPGHGDGMDSFSVHADMQKQASTSSDCDTTQSFKDKHKYAASSMQPDLINQQDHAGNQEIKTDEAHMCRSEPSSLPVMCEPNTCSCPSAEIGSTDAVLRDSGSKSRAREVDIWQESSSLNIDVSTEIIKEIGDLVADGYLNHITDSGGTNSASDVTESKSHGPRFEVHTLDINNRNEAAKLRQIQSDSAEQAGVARASVSLLGHPIVPSTHEEHEPRIDENFLNCENVHSDEVINSNDEEKALDMGSTTMERDSSLDHVPADVESEPAEEHWRPPVCSPQHAMEVNTEYETSGEQYVAKSPSRGSGSLKASATTATAALPNPAPNTTTTSNTDGAIATTLPALSRQLAVGARGGSIGLQTDSELLSEHARGLDGDKVATDERSVEVGEEEEDEFGVFMQAGEEQIWTEGFSELQQVPCGKHDGIDLQNASDATQPMSWISEWTGVQSFPHSDDTWTAFKQDSDIGRVERERTAGGQWWSATAAENTNLTLSSLHNVANVFFEAFPAVETSCGDPDCIPTLKELLKGPPEKNIDGKPGNQSLLDGLQDLDQMIDVKYKRAESLSRKLLLQSLHLGPLNSECVTGHKQITARFSPNLPTSNQQLAAKAKRRLSYDINRNIMA